MAALAVPLVVSCSGKTEEVCKADLCTDPVYLCDGNRNQTELVINGRSTSSSDLQVDVLVEVDGNPPATTPLTVTPVTSGKKVVELARVRGVSGHPVTVRIKVRRDAHTSLEVRSATLDPGEQCPQDA